MSNDTPLEDTLATAIDAGDGESVSLGDVLESYSDRTFGAIFTILGLLVVVPPIGGIPGLPAIVGAVLLLFSIQKLFGRSHVWLPGFINSISMSKSKLHSAEEKAGPVLSRIDALITDRLTWAVSGPARYGAAILVSLLALALIPLELVPFAVALPGLAITFVGVALLSRDGALMLIAYAISIIAAFVLFKFA